MSGHGNVGNFEDREIAAVQEIEKEMAGESQADSFVLFVGLCCSSEFVFAASHDIASMSESLRDDAGIRSLRGKSAATEIACTNFVRAPPPKSDSAGSDVKIAWNIKRSLGSAQQGFQQHPMITQHLVGEILPAIKSLTQSVLSHEKTGHVDASAGGQTSIEDLHATSMQNMHVSAATKRKLTREARSVSPSGRSIPTDRSSKSAQHGSVTHRSSGTVTHRGPRGNAILSSLENDLTREALVSSLTGAGAPHSELVQPLHDHLQGASSSFRSLVPNVYTETYRTKPWSTKNAGSQTPSEAIFAFEMKYGDNLKSVSTGVPDMLLPNGWLHESGISSKLIKMSVRGVREGMKVKELVLLLNDALSDALCKIRGLRASCLKTMILAHVHIQNAQNNKQEMLLNLEMATKDLKARQQEWATEQQIWSDKHKQEEKRRAADAQRRARLKERVLRRMLHGQLATAWSSWKWSCKESKRVRTVTKRVALRWKNRSTSKMMLCWKQRMKDNRRLRNILKRVVGRWSHQSLSLTFDTWSTHSVQSKHQRSVLEKVSRRMKNTLTFKALSTWEHRVGEMWHQRKVLEKMALRMKNTLVYKSWSTWEEHAGDLRHQRSLLEKMALRMRNACSFKAFLSWHAEAVELKRQAAVGAKVLLRWRNQVIAKMFVSWEQSWSESKRLHRVATKVVRQWQLGALARAWVGWKENSREQAKQRGTGSKVVMRWANRALFKVFACWSDHAAHIRHQREVLEKMLQRMHNTLLYKGWVTWEDHANEMQRQRKVLEKMALRMKNTLVYKSWSTWEEAVEEANRTLQLQQVLM